MSRTSGKKEDILRRKEARDSWRHFTGLDVVADSPILFSFQCLPDPLLRLAPVSSPYCVVPAWAGLYVKTFHLHSFATGWEEGGAQLCGLGRHKRLSSRAQAYKLELTFSLKKK